MDGAARGRWCLPWGWTALTDRHELLEIDREGHPSSRGELANEVFHGWHGDAPVATSLHDALWIDPWLYRVTELALHRHDATGTLIVSITLPRAPFGDAVRASPLPLNLPPEWFPNTLELSYDPFRRRLLASHGLLGAWLASMSLDGELAWVRLLDRACCNSVRALTDMIVHVTSRGEKVTFLSPDGAILLSHHVPRVLYAVPDGRGGACARTVQGVVGFDARGERSWELEIEHVQGIAAHDGILYVVGGPPGPLRLSAYEPRA